jgi:hypothetical protein
MPIANLYSSFEWSVGNMSTPGVSPGTSVTPAQNAMGNWANLLGALAHDVFGVMVNINTGGVATKSRDILVNIGVDTAGGTSYATVIPYLLGSCAGSYNLITTGGGGHWYYFPLFIKVGSTVAAQASINNATVGTVYVGIVCYGLPMRPCLEKVGSFVTAFGTTAASSAGTAVTSGSSGSKGNFTLLGTTTQDLWWWQLGIGCRSSAMAVLYYTADLATGASASANKIIIPDKQFVTSTDETLSVYGMQDVSAYSETPAGSKVYARIACNGATPDANLSAIAYGLGG